MFPLRSARAPSRSRCSARTSAWTFVPLSLLAAVAAWAGPKEDMKALSVKFLALRSYHVTMESSDKRMQKMEMDFVAPNRYRMQMPMGTQYVIGDTMYMTIDGRTMKIPMPKGTMTQWRETDRVFREVELMQIEALGADTVNGKPAKKYRMTQTTHKPATTSLIWVGMDGYPLRMETSGTAGKRASTMTVHYSRFNDPGIRIEPPK
jgi:outer membrane lipoprotein-sorting protein